MQPDLRSAADAPVLLVACDYDGTLAPIVEDPAVAHPDQDALRALAHLAGLPNTHVAVISGRARAELERLLGPLQGARLIGGHGAEWGDGEPSTRAIEVATRLHHVADQFPGALVESKPSGAAFHYRQVDDGAAERAAEAAEEAAGELAIRVVHGKRVVEFSTSDADKGQALRRLRRELAPDVTVFIGDDVTDEDAFAVLGPTDIGVKVGDGDSAARWRVPDQASVAALLSDLAAARR